MNPQNRHGNLVQISRPIQSCKTAQSGCQYTTWKCDQACKDTGYDGLSIGTTSNHGAKQPIRNHARINTCAKPDQRSRDGRTRKGRTENQVADAFWIGCCQMNGSWPRKRLSQKTQRAVGKIALIPSAQGPIVWEDITRWLDNDTC